MLCNVNMSLTGQGYTQVAAPPTEPEAGFCIGLTCSGVVASIRPRGDCWSGTREHPSGTPVVLLLSEKMQHRLNGHIVGVSRERRVTVSEPRFHSATSISPRPTSVPLCAESAHVADVVTAAGCSDMIDSSVSRNADSCKRRAAPPAGNGTRATQERSGHDLDVAGTAVRCRSRTTATTRQPPA
jgi:hypothetical protein